MSPKSLYIILFLAAFSLPGLAQKRNPSLKATLDSLEYAGNDSAVIATLQNLLKEYSGVKEQLAIKYRLTARATVAQKFNLAITLGTEALYLAQQQKADSMEAAFNKLLGITYYYLDERKRSIPYFEKAAAIAKEKDLWMLEAAAYNNLGAVLTDLKQAEKAEPLLLRSIEIMESHGKTNHPNTNKTYRILASYYLSIGQSDKAEGLFRSLIAKSRKSKDISLLSGSLLFYSNMLADQKRYDEAAAMSAEALSYLRSDKNFHDMLGGMRTHATHLHKAGRTEEAFALQNEAYTRMQKSFTTDLEKQVSEVEVKYKTAQLKQEKELAEVTAKKRQQIYLFGFAAVLASVLVLFYIFNLRKNTRQRLEAQQHRLKALIEGEEKERTRIAKDLHDGIVQDLTAIKLKVQASGKEDELLTAVSSDIDRAAREVRNIAYQMMPLALREYGLTKAMDDLLQKALAPLNVRYEFETVNLEERLPENIEVCIYRIAQELLNNVIKHSKASFVSVVISKHKEAVSFILEDNGEGFDETQIRKGIGMTGLSSRLEIVNGELKYESSKGSGTMAIIKIPL